ncbi:hypothetical protein EVAR_92666_1 [Eumeta japonica]|uniref:Uncharacterized protein n=1 Tax=Eumeta variegata TaxID=151549 RepID=A0A4C1SXS8_EUMVA|nr:hypothetical protein EVAR_92666_1 [Eumeta japonica]
MPEPPARSLDYCPDVVGKSTYGKVNLVCRRDVIGNAVEVWSVDFLKRGRHSFQLVILRECDIYRRGSMCDDMGKHVDVEGAMIPKF